MRKGRLGVVVAAAALVAAFSLAACGGSSSSISADKNQITTAIQAATTSGDPGACTKYQTPRFTGQTNGGSTGQAAVKSCEQNAANSAASKADVSNVSVNGNSATATITLTGSALNGQTVDVGLVKQGGQWKLDDFKGFASFNKDAIIASLPQQIGSAGGGSPQLVACVRRQLEATPDKEIEDSFLGNSSALEQGIGAACGKYFKGGK
jgi:hypothetical protein